MGSGPGSAMSSAQTPPRSTSAMIASSRHSYSGSRAWAATPRRKNRRAASTGWSPCLRPPDDIGFTLTPARVSGPVHRRYRRGPACISTRSASRQTSARSVTRSSTFSARSSATSSSRPSTATAVTSAPTSAPSSSPSPCTECSTRRTTSSSGTPATRRTCTSWSPGARQAFTDGLRQPGGLSGYPSREESEHDWVENSHASTILSYAHGLATALENARGRAAAAGSSPSSATARSRAAWPTRG